MTKKDNKILNFIILHFSFFIFSLSTVLIKYATNYPLLSFKCCLFYVLSILSLGIYAFLWQIVLKKFPLVI